MKVNAFLTAMIVVGTLVLGIGISKAAGYWRTESSKVPSRLSQGAFSGEYDPSDIRGSFSFSDIESAFGIVPAIMAEAFGLPGNNPGDHQAKKLEEVWTGLEGDVEVGTDSIRLFTALWKGLPHEPEPTTVLPVRAVEILLTENRISADAAEELMARAVNIPDSVREAFDATSISTPPAEAGETSEEHSATEGEIKGLTTFGDLRSWGVTEEAWEEAFDKPMGKRATTVKDWVENEGLSMGSVKTTAQELVDAAE